MLLITIDGSDPSQVEREYEAIGEWCLDAGAQEVYVADNFTTSERIWKVRRNIAEACSLISHHQNNEDIVVPPAAIPELVGGIGELAERYGVRPVCFGHAGDGNIHARLIKDPDWTLEHWYEVAPKMQVELYELTATLGGRLSGEHGIGHKRKDYMTTVVSETYLEMLRAVKRALDPNNVLNPGKIFDV